MAAKELADHLDSLIGGILNVASAGRKPTLRSAKNYFRSFSRQDYATAVGKHFDRPQLLEILREMRTGLPTLNQEVFSITDPRRLASIATGLGAVLRTNAFEGSHGPSLRGFYVEDCGLLKQPLIWVNTATHPVGLAAAFWHEIGHHLTRRTFDHRAQPVSLLFSTNYQDHVTDPQEIAADMLMVLACYPKPAAKRLFCDSKGQVLRHDANQLVSKARPYVRSVTGFDFDSRISAKENLHRLAGMIHVAKLRSVLLSEYEI